MGLVGIYNLKLFALLIITILIAGIIPISQPAFAVSNGEAATTVLGQPDFTTHAIATSATGEHYPYGITFDSSGNLWVADDNNNRVLKYLGPFTGNPNCPAGEYYDSTSGVCVQAPAGSYVSTSGATSATLCPAGTYSSAVGATSSATCATAPPGSYAGTAGSTSATLCPAGTYSSAVGATSSATCVQAPAGSYAGTAGSTSATLCPANTYCPNPGTVTPLSCPVGATSNAGSTSCIAPAGSYLDTTTGTIVLCPAGTFTATAGQTACTPAPPGSYAGTAGSTSATLCPANTYCPNPGTVTPLSCPSGTTSSAGATSCTQIVSPSHGTIAASNGAGQITFNTNAGGFSSLSPISQSSLPTSPPPGNYPLGFFSWNITGFLPATSVTISVTAPTTLAPQSNYFKLVGGTWVAIPVTVLGNKMTFSIADNGPYDGNPAVGTISDPAGIAAPTNGRINGDGKIGTGADFGFEVSSDTDRTHSIKGTLDYNDKGAKLSLDSNSISFLSVDTTTSQATFVGIGSIDMNNKHSTGDTFVVTISDPDKSGDRDTFSITVTDSTGKIIYTNSGTVKGHIEIHKFSDHDDKSDSGIQH